MKKEHFVASGKTIPYQNISTNTMPEINDVDYQGKTTGNASSSPEEPRDRYHIVRVTMYLFGITSLLPWNFFIQANDYWMYKFRNVSIPFDPNTEEKTNLQATFASYLAIASKVPYVIFLLINTAISRSVLPTKRIGYPLAIMIAFFVVTTVMVKINTDKNEAVFFAVTICIVVAINSMCGFVQGGGTGVAGSLPKRFMGYNVNGMALGGILASIAQILSLLGDTSPTDSAIIYFLCAVAALCITFVFFRLMLKSEFYQFHMPQQTTMKEKIDITNTTERNMSLFQIFQKLWVYAVSVTLLFWVTLAALPAVVVLVVSTSGDQTLWTGRLFLPVSCFLLFNVSDLVSRLVALQVMIPPKGKYVTLTLALLRIIFIPLLMLCNAHPRSHLPVIFDSDADFIVITMFFGFTNGYLCTVVLTHGPKEVETEHQEIAGSIMAFFLGLGLMLGSVSSYGIVKLL